MRISTTFPSVPASARRLALTLLLGVAAAVLIAPAASAAPLFSGAELGRANYVPSDLNGVSMLTDGSAIVVGSYGADNNQTGTFNLAGGTALPTVTYGTRYGFVAKRAANGTYVWQHAITVTDGDVVSVLDVAALPDGSAIIVGKYRGTIGFGGVTLGPSPGTANHQTLFAAKVKADGSGFAWALSGGGTNESELVGVGVLADGSAVVTGDFYGTIQVGGSTLTSAGGADVLAARIRPDGSGFTWAIRGGGTSDDYALGGSVTADGAAYLAGSCDDFATFGQSTVDCRSSNGDGRPLILKSNVDGTGWAWVLVPSIPGTPSVGDGSFANDVATLPDGSAVVVGSFVGTATFGSTVLAGSTTSDRAFVTKVKGDGSGFAWASQVDSGSAHSYASSISARADGSAVVTGSFDAGSAVVGSATLVGAAASNIFVAEVGSAGTFNSALVAGSSGWWYGHAVSALPDGAAVVVGTATGTATFGSTSLATNVIANAADLFVTGVLLAPIAPAAPTAAAGAARATVAITPLAGASITRYTVTASPGGRTCAIVPPATSCTVDGLTNGTAYTFTVTAENAAGTSASSAASAAVTPRKAASQAPRLAKAPRIVRAGLSVSLVSSVRVGAAGPLSQRATYRSSARAAKTVAACVTVKRVQRAGAVTITCRLNAKARAALRRGALRLTLVTTFTETGKTAASTTRRVTVPATKKSPARPLG